MPKRRGLLLLASLTALAACPGPDATEQTTDGPATSGTGSSSTSSSSSGATGSTAPDPTDPGSTDPGSTDTGSTGTGSTDTGAADCEVSWVVPSVTAEELAAHDLRWIGCELTACGPEDSPQPGEPSLLCADFAIEDAPLTYLGFIHPNMSGAFTTEDVVSDTNIAWLDAPRHTYRLGEHVYILSEGDGAADQLQVFYAARALEVLRTVYPSAYQQIVADTMAFPAEPPLDGFGWKNRLRSVVISFDTSPFYIAASLTVLDTIPAANVRMGYDEYHNVAAISIDRETILGASETKGSRPIYDRPTDDENFLRYMREGVAETLIHELLHLRIDRLNSVDEDMNELYGRRGLQDVCAQWELEEALVASTSLLYFREAGGLSDTYIDYYDPVLDGNLAIMMACPEYATWAEQFSEPSGVDPRYDLRLFDLE